ncbi:Resolvase, N terminal domain [Brevibacterium aurantiacum]|uniref:Resolvase, N terminal domain n=2 Tax=Brevibacterium aurantiacum TaxID=273384 RepID=A0A2H1IS27_BREAU|nr:Resolvase, N terminal domain [Brevibacterium aurantiacum]
MDNAIIYARSAGNSEQQVKRQRKLCRSYLREVGLTEVGFVAEYGHPGRGLSVVVNAAASKGATEVIICDLSRLGRTSLVNLKNSNLLEEAGLTIHVAAGIVSGPVTDDDIRDKMLLFAETDLNTLYGDDVTER